MNILHVTRSLGKLPRYGLQKSLMPLISGLKEQGHNVELLDNAIVKNMHLRPCESRLIKMYLGYMRGRFGEKGKSAWYVLRERVEIGIRAAKIARQKNITHVHCHDILLGVTYDFFRKWYNATPVWGITEHAYGRFVKLRNGISTSEQSLKVLQKQELKATRKAKWIIFPTNSGMNQFLEDMQINAPSGRWHVIPHTVELKLADRKTAREKLGIASGEKLLVAVGVLLPMKRFDLLLKAVAHVPGELLQRIIILGDGPEQDRLFQLAKTLNLPQQLQIRVTNNIGDYLAAADVYVSTTSTESFGLANCEALYARVPSVLTAVDAVPEIVGDAAILTNDQPEQIAAAIQSILESKELRNKLKSKAKTLTTMWPDRRRLADKMAEIYSQC